MNVQWFDGLDGYDFTTLPHVTLKALSRLSPYKKTGQCKTCPDPEGKPNQTLGFAINKKRSRGIPGFGGMCRLLFREKTHT